MKTSLENTLMWACDNFQIYREDLERFIDFESGRLDFSKISAFDMHRAMRPVTKDDLLKRIKPYLAADDDYVAEVTRSSGTSGLQSIKIRSSYELALMKEALTSKNRFQQTEIILQFINAYHGVGVTVDPSLYVQVDVSSKASVFSGIGMLLKNFDLPRAKSRINSIVGSVNNVLQFTAYLEHLGISSDQFSIESVACSGSYLSDNSARKISNYWGIEPTNFFSLSEFRGVAYICPKCGALQFTSNIIPFAINLTNDAPLERGYGRLCVTEVLPFGLCQPLIKYLSGDLVEVIDDPCCELHRGNIRRVGRISDCVFHPDDSASVLLTSQDLYEAVDIKEVLREEVWLNYVDELPSKFFGQPLARAFSERNNGLRVVVEINVDAGNKLDVCQKVYDRLMQRSATLRSEVAKKNVSLCVCVNDKLFSGLKK
ncbi:hypothetical protein [Burkholderia gladioli]|uniref:hypothetical protein n=1 Tax=Burkholderia gladioli TaxID=28095 RepID=UPI00163ECBD0|nr:hypothetical protein [Burkholderia gladioli]